MVLKEKSDIQQYTEHDTAATVILKYVRRELARRRLRQLKRERNAARKMQRCIRHFLHCRRELRKVQRHEAATRLQKTYRGHYWRTYYVYQLRPWLIQERAKRILAKHIKRLYTGYQCRRAYRKMKVMKKGPMRYEEWMAIMKKAGKPRRSYGLFEEYIYPGFKDVKFYCNKLTEVCTWDQPPQWVQKDRDESKVRGHDDAKHEGWLMTSVLLLARKWSTSCCTASRGSRRGLLARSRYQRICQDRV
jgi:hypothetical protein